MQVRHTVNKRATKFSEPEILSLVNGSMMTGTGKIRNSNVERKRILEMNLK